ncbi:MAG: hypothetical protein MUF00_11340 [Gemmatimonadaceae bacterium]|jgi:hypothetical protein|nr:hypothetical protein [Gemmatimonadaceae bacterium]
MMSTPFGGVLLGGVYALPVALLMACTPTTDAPLAPDDSVAPPAAVVMPAEMQQIIPSSLQVALDDLEQRVLPALDGDAARALGGALQSLRDAATLGDLRAARAASGQLHATAVALAEQGHSALAVDLSVVDLVTAAIEAELTPPLRPVR